MRQERPDLPAFLLGRAQKNLELQTAGGRGDFVERIAPLLRKVTNEVERWGHLVFMAEKLAVPLRSLERQLFPQTDSHRGPARKRQAETLPARPGTKRYPRRIRSGVFVVPPTRIVDEGRFSDDLLPDFMDADLGGLYSLLLQLAPHDVEEHWFHRLNGKATDEQVELLSRMAMEPLPPASVGDVQAMKDYFERMRQRRRGFRLGQVAQQLRNEHDESEQRRLLEATDQLAKKRQPAALLGSGSLGGSN